MKISASYESKIGAKTLFGSSTFLQLMTAFSERVHEVFWLVSVNSLYLSHCLKSLVYFYCSSLFIYVYVQ